MLFLKRNVALKECLKIQTKTSTKFSTAFWMPTKQPQKQSRRWQLFVQRLYSLIYWIYRSHTMSNLTYLGIHQLVWFQLQFRGCPRDGFRELIESWPTFLVSNHFALCTVWHKHGIQNASVSGFCQLFSHPSYSITLQTHPIDSILPPSVFCWVIIPPRFNPHHQNSHNNDGNSATAEPTRWGRLWSPLPSLSPPVWLHWAIRADSIRLWYQLEWCVQNYPWPGPELVHHNTAAQGEKFQHRCNHRFTLLLCLPCRRPRQIDLFIPHIWGGACQYALVAIPITSHQGQTSTQKRPQRKQQHSKPHPEPKSAPHYPNYVSFAGYNTTHYPHW